MSSVHRVAPHEMFYYTSTGITTQAILEEQMSKLGTVLNHARKWIDGSEVENNNASVITDILTGWDFGDASARRKVRIINDWANTRLAIQVNTGTDQAAVWVDLLFINTTTYVVTFAGGINAGGNSTIDGTLTMGGNIDMNWFYIRNLAGIDGIQVTSAGRQYTTTFTAQTSVVVTHNLNTLTPIVVVYQTSDGKEVLPENIVVTSANVVTVTFGEAAVTGTILVTGGVGQVGINISDGDTTIQYTPQIQVNPASFYVTQDSHGFAQINLQPIVGLGSVNVTDGTRTVSSAPTVGFAGDDFYLSGSNPPVVNLTDNPTFETIRVNQYAEMAAATQPSAPASQTLRMFGAVANSGHTSPQIIDSDGTVMDTLRDTVLVARNDTGSGMTIGQLVYFTGSTGNTPNIALAKADARTTSPARAVCMESIANNASGRVMMTGTLTGADLSAYNEGDRLYLSGSVAGGFTTTEPAHPNASQLIGVVLRNNANGILQFVPAHADGQQFGTNQSTWVIGTSSAASAILTPASTAARTFTFPDRTGTVALTDQLNDFYFLTVRDIDLTPAVKTRTLEFTNGSVSDQGNGVARITVIGGIDVSDGVHNYTGKSKLAFNPNGGFYLSQTAAGDPMVNLRYDKDIYPVFVELGGAINAVTDPFAQYPYTIEYADYDCRSGSISGGFYIIPAINPNGLGRRVGRGQPVSGLDGLSISTTPRRTAATAANRAVNPGDAVMFSAYGNSSAKHVRVTLVTKKP